MAKVSPIKDSNVVKLVKQELKKNRIRDYVLFTLGTATGLRAGDLVRLKVQDVQGTHLTLTESKTGKYKSVKLSKEARSAIKELTAGMNPNSWLFLSRQGGNHITVKRVGQIIKEVMTKLNIAGNYASHTIRKTFAYMLYRATGNDISKVMNALNHSKQDITLRYLGLDQEQFDADIDLLSVYL